MITMKRNVLLVNVLEMKRRRYGSGLSWGWQLCYYEVPVGNLEVLDFTAENSI